MNDSPETPQDSAQHHDDDGRVLTKLVDGLQDGASKVASSILNRKASGQDSIERLIDLILKAMNRREVLERILRSDFIKNVRDMQSEITEILGLASQADVHEIRAQLNDITQRLETLQKTLDDIVVQVEDEP